MFPSVVEVGGEVILVESAVLSAVSSIIVGGSSYWVGVKLMGKGESS